MINDALLSGATHMIDVLVRNNVDIVGLMKVPWSFYPPQLAMLVFPKVCVFVSGKEPREMAAVECNGEQPIGGL